MNPDFDITPVVWKKSFKKEKLSDDKNYPVYTKRDQALDGPDPPPPAKSQLSIALELQQARLAKKITQKKLAESLNVPKKEIIEYESGARVPNKAMVRKIMNHLK